MSFGRRRDVGLRRVARLLFLAAAMPPVARASVWTGADGNSSWSDPNNWNPVGVPGNGDGATFTDIDGVSRTINYDYTGTAVSLTTLTVALANGNGQAVNAIDMAGNTLNVTQSESIGADMGLGPQTVGYGAFVQSGGSNTTPNLVISGALSSYTLAGGSLSAGMLDVGGTFTWTGGTLSVDNVLQGGGAFSDTGNLTLGPGGNVSSYTLFSGQLQVGSLSGTGGALDWQAGTLAIAEGNLTIGPGGPLGNTLTLSNSQTLSITNPFDALYVTGKLALGAGTVNTTALYNSGTIDLGQGTMNVTNSNLTIGSGGPFGSTLSLTNLQTLSVTNPNYSLDVSGTLNLNGGTLNVANLQTSGKFNWTSGILDFTNGLVIGRGGSLGTTFTQTAGQTLEVNGGNGLVLQGTANLESGFDTLSNLVVGGFPATLNLSGNSVLNCPGEVIGFDTIPGAVGQVTQTGGLNEVQSLYLGFGDTGTTAIYTLSAGQVYAAKGEVLGYLGGDPGTFTQSGGTNTILTGGLNISASDSYVQSGGSNTVYSGGLLLMGSYALSGTGSLQVTGGENIQEGLSVFYQSGGTNVTDYISLGDDQSFSADYYFTGGTASVSGNIVVQDGVHGLDSVVVSGQGILNCAGTISVLDSTSGSLVVGGTLGGGTINGGSLLVDGLYNQTSGTATFGQILGTGQATITGGKTTILTAGARNQLGGLTVLAPGTLDLTNNSLAINYGAPQADPVSAITVAIAVGYNGGTWTGVGITSSSAAVNPRRWALGYLDGGTDAQALSLGYVLANQIIIAYTLAGDALLQGSVGFDDLMVVVQHWGQTGWDWANGNFNYDPNGSVGLYDLIAVAENYGQSLSFGSGESQGTVSMAWREIDTTNAVPEPGAILTTVGAARMMQRRGRRITRTQKFNIH